jgi:hypothetical protein
LAPFIGLAPESGEPLLAVQTRYRAQQFGVSRTIGQFNKTCTQLFQAMLDAG